MPIHSTTKCNRFINNSNNFIAFYRNYRWNYKEKKEKKERMSNEIKNRRVCYKKKKKTEEEKQLVICHV
jgi:hypothetical protein